jgi:hypothetical protein
MNWFGTKVGADAAEQGVTSGAGAGVGRYLAGAKRPLEATTLGGDDKAKKKKLGFGDFAGW